MIKSALQSFGLNQKEVKVYLACLELGQARVSEIAKKSAVERTNCYSILDKLMSLGLVFEIKLKGRRQIAAEPPEKIELLLQDRQQKIKQVLPELKSIYNLSPNKPKIRFYEGADGIFQFFKEKYRILQAGETQYHCGPDDDKLNQVLGVKVVDKLIAERVSKGIKSQVITNKTVRTGRLARQAGQLREVKWIKRKNIPSRLHIFGNKIGLMSLEQEPMVVIIEDSAIADLMRMFFKAMWEQIK